MASLEKECKEALTGAFKDRIDFIEELFTNKSNPKIKEEEPAKKKLHKTEEQSEKEKSEDEEDLF